GAEHDADRSRLVLGALEAVEVVHVHLHLPEVLVNELSELQVHEHERSKQSVVEHEVDVKVIAVERDALLARDEAEALPELEKKFLKPLDDRALEVRLEPRRPLLEPEELEDER